MKKLITILMLFFCGIVYAQGDLDYSVKGTVMDASGGRPVAMVSVMVPGRNYATVTNADGSFIIKADAPISELAFSRLGYRDAREKVSGDEITVKMVPIVYPLKEASIVSGDPLEIIEAAMEKIGDNYPAQPELLRCFYRETLQKRQRYISVSEAVARIYKGSYRHPGLRSDGAALEKSRVIMSQRKGDTLSVRMMGGPTLAITFDAVKNRDILLNKEDLKLYSFRMESPAYIADRLQFVISFAPAIMADYALYYGKLFIDRETLAFSRMELSLDMSDKYKATRVMLVRKPLSLRFTPQELTLAINYRMQDGVSRIDYFRSSMSFSCDQKKRLIATNYKVVNELVVTDKIEPAEPIGKDELFHSKDVLDDKAPLFLDPDFWKDYNIIEPSESLEHAVARLRK